LNHGRFAPKRKKTEKDERPTITEKWATRCLSTSWEMTLNGNSLPRPTDLLHHEKAPRRRFILPDTERAQMMESKPLESITVLDCGQLYAGPLAATFMGDFGAKVIKIEDPDGGDAVRGYGQFEEELAWKWVGRNKKSVPIDLKSDRGKDVFRELVAETDVLVESFRPGTLEEWGVGWETLSEINPDLVMIRTTGFGQDSRYADKAGFGTLAESMSGFAYVTGQPDGPPQLPALGLADSIAALASTFAAMMALYWRDQEGGTGQFIDTSLLEPIFGIMGEYPVDYSVKGMIHERMGNRSAYTAPRNTYRTKDERWVAISGSAESIARRVLAIVGGDELLNDPRFQTMEDRIEHVDALDEKIQEWMSEQTRSEAIEIFDEEGAAIAPIYNIEDIFEDPYFRERDALLEIDDPEVDDLTMPGVFPKLSKTPGTVEHAGPALGAHTIEVLIEHTSLSNSEIADLLADGIVATEDEN
jgi:formyl-CoA transferase